MSPQPEDDNLFLTRDELRRLEARFDSRLQAELGLRDDRVAAIASRIDLTEKYTDALAERLDDGLETVGRRFDALHSWFDGLDSKIVDWKDGMLQMMKENRDTVARITLIGVAATLVCALSAVLVVALVSN